MAKLFTPSVRCPVCSHANDSDFRFCQRCGYRRRVLPSATTKPPSIDLASINNRLQQLLNFDQATSYTKQKDSLQKELEAFLSALPGCVSLATVTPQDLCRFLIFKDKDGRTQVHRNSCKFIGQRGKHSCGCPLQLSYNTVDSYTVEPRLATTPSIRQTRYCDHFFVARRKAHSFSYLKTPLIRPPHYYDQRPPFGVLSRCTLLIRPVKMLGGAAE